MAARAHGGAPSAPAGPVSNGAGRRRSVRAAGRACRLRGQYTRPDRAGTLSQGEAQTKSRWRVDVHDQWGWVCEWATWLRGTGFLHRVMVRWAPPTPPRVASFPSMGHSWPVYRSLMSHGARLTPSWTPSVWELRIVHQMSTPKQQSPKPASFPKGESAAKREKENEKKWSKQVWSVGWTGIPFVLLDRQDELNLDPIDLNVLLQILKHWWRVGDTAWPSKRSIAKRIGKSEKTVQRSIRKMRKSGLLDYVQKIRADGGKGPNEYSFAGLVAKLGPLAQDEHERRKRKGGAADA